MRTKAEGIRGESAAAGYLSEKGYEILQTNAKLGGIEVDIIAKSPDGAIVFCEVKTRQTYSMGHPFEQITLTQRKRYRRFAEMYRISRRLYDSDFRFDAIAVSGDEIEHIENAF